VPVYLDHNATTPLRPEVLEAMLPLLSGEPAANPSSPHGPGQRARLAVEQAREELAALLDCDPMEVIFTSGGTEADNLAVLGFMEASDRRFPAQVVSTAIEHPAVEECLSHLESAGTTVARVPPGTSGTIEAERVLESLRPETRLVTAMLANNETGAVVPVAEIAAPARERGIAVHTDAVQAAGRLPVSFRKLGVDLLSVSSHKMGGPQGVGALVAGRDVPLAPRLLGGPQERRRRGGTEPVALIAGFGEAARLAREEMGRWERVTRPLRDRFEEEVRARFPTARLHTSLSRLPNTASVAFMGRSAEALVMAADLAGISISTGSACSSGATLPSRVLREMGLGAEEVASTIRVSFGPGNTDEDLDRLIAAIEQFMAQGSEPCLSTRREAEES
jgi:cysteine desulfurase